MAMGKTRIEAFSDGVIAILITIMVLELKTPQGSNLSALLAFLPTFEGYVLSFVFLGIYWNNHHHLFHAVQRVSGGALWANLHLLFWLSLVPFVTSWMSASGYAQSPVAAYGVVLLMSGAAYYLLSRLLIHHDGKGSPIASALGSDVKGLASLGLYIVAIPLAYVDARLSRGLYVLVALIWLVPDRRIEKTLAHKEI